MDAKNTRITLMWLAVCVLVVPGPAATADEGEKPDTTQPTLKTRTTADPGRKPQSLAGLAATIRLRKSAGNEGSGVMIDKATLDELAKTGVISVSGSATATEEEPATEESAPTTTGAPSDDLQKRYDTQAQKIDNLEKGLQEFDQRVQDRRTPHTSVMPHDLPPGVRNPNLITRERVEAEIAEERAKLEAMTRQARRAGVELKRSPPQSESQE